METKQGLQKLSKDLKKNTWNPGSPVPPISAGAVKKEKTVHDFIPFEKVKKEEAEMMFEEKIRVPGVNEPSYLPPVTTLPGHMGCKEYLAMSTLKAQSFDETYDPDKGIDRGTIFPALDLPFMGEGGKGAKVK